MSRQHTPLLGSTGLLIGDKPGMSGNGPTGTENAFDIYYPGGVLNGTWWFGAYPPYWATWSAELFGTEGAGNMSFNGVGATGNDAGLYVTGDFAAGETIHFLLRRNGLASNGHLLASLKELNQYIGGAYQMTRLVGAPAPGFPKAMNAPAIGDFYVSNVAIPPTFGNVAVYFQGVLSDPPLVQPPIEASNGLRAN